MPRPKRVHVPGAVYSVTQQSTPQKRLFEDKQDFNTYLDLISLYKQKHGFKLFAFSLMPEKLHLVMELSEKGSLSEIMRDLTSRYSKYYNGRYQSEGALFKGRFRTCVIEKEQHFASLLSYCHTASSLAAENSSAFLSSFGGAWKTDFPAGTALHRLMRDEESEISGLFAGKDAYPRIPTLTAAETALWEERLSKPHVGSETFQHRIKHALEAESAASSPVAETMPAVLAAPAAAFTIKGSLLGLAAAGFLFASIPLWLQHSRAVPAARPAAPHPATVTAVVKNETPQPQADTQLLQGTEWDVQLTPLQKTADDKTVDHDRLVFQQNRMISEKLTSGGFEPSFYSLTVTPDGTFVWETMQKSANGDIVSWRGEMKGEHMQGVLSRESTSGEKAAFSFVGAMNAGGGAKS